jgi:hypothetical protein
MVDMTEDFLAKAKTYLGEEGKRVRNYFCCGLQDFSPEPNSYDVIWIQWVIGKACIGHPALPICPLLSSPQALGAQALLMPTPWVPVPQPLPLLDCFTSTLAALPGQFFIQETFSDQLLNQRSGSFVRISFISLFWPQTCGLLARPPEH